MSIVDKIQRWFSKQETRSLQADQVHSEFDAETDRVDPQHKEHMMDRVEQIDQEVADEKGL